MDLATDVAARGRSAVAVVVLALASALCLAAILLWRLLRERDRLRRGLSEAARQIERERDAATTADQGRTRFLAAAGHDLRQPLQALALFVAALSQKPMPDDLRHLVGRIEGSLETLEHLLDSLLDLSRLDAGAVEAHSMSFPLQTLFNRMMLEFVPQAERKGIRMTMVATSAIVRSDPTLLERILRNLLSNAIRYTRQGGILLGCRRHGTDLRIEIWDSGPGIALCDQAAIFDEFRQVGGGDHRQGLGLGLAIVRRLADLLGARIDLRSDVDRGSMFAVILARPDLQPRPPAIDAADWMRPPRNAMAEQTTSDTYNCGSQTHKKLNGTCSVS